MTFRETTHAPIVQEAMAYAALDIPRDEMKHVDAVASMVCSSVSVPSLPHQEMCRFQAFLKVYQTISTKKVFFSPLPLVARVIDFVQAFGVCTCTDCLHIPPTKSLSNAHQRHHGFY